MQKTPFIILLVIIVIVGATWFVSNDATDTSQTSQTPETQTLTPINENATANDARVTEVITESAADNAADQSITQDLPLPVDSELNAGTYTTYSSEKLAATNGDIIMHFSAEWCPSCRSLKSDINSKLNQIPSNVTIFDVDFDTETALKQKYGITTQHSFVQVDAEGNLIKKWSGSPSLESLVAELN